MKRESLIKILRLAIMQSQKSFNAGCFPAGAIVTESGVIVGQGISDVIDYGHAERNAIDDAINHEGSHKLLENAILYGSMEPCLMCFLTAIHAGIRTFIFACEKSAVRPEYYEGNLSLTDVVKSLPQSEDISLIHISELEDEALQIVKLWEQKHSIGSIKNN